ncbi:MAG TPA: FG-GAP-like repeat-containing protein [Saprospiraceae bacterium]
MMRTVTFLAILLSIFTSTAFSQAQFDNRNDLLADKNIHSAVPVGIADMNGDGLDDIVSLNFGSTLFIQYQTADPARPFVRYEVPLFVDNAEQNDICIADFNNDGANDILAVGSYDRVKVLYSVPNTYSFNLTHIVVDIFFSQGASAGDFNHDGWVDVVMLNDNGLNYTLMNDGTGTLVEQDLFDFVTVPPSDNSGNYGSVYTDFDMDGDNDFYIAKCRQGVNNPNDPRRIDALFVNDGHGNYTEDAATYGLADGRQTWTADFGDIDNDGDLDLFKTQHDVISELFENINNDTFINITPSTGLVIGGVPLQGMFRDFDNDGFQDILVSGDRLDYYHNNGDKTFTKVESFGSVIFGTFALGDLNHDGFTDVYASRVIPFNNPDPQREDILFLNQPNDNHYLGLNLKDTHGNPSAIGAMALLYGPWGIQVREVRGGEQYGISSGHSILFGLGEQTTYDSLVIRWADGERENFGILDTDKTWTLTRGACKKLPLEILDPLVVLCQQDTLTIRLESALPLIRWSDGSTADSLVITHEGIYYAILQDMDGCIVNTNPLEVGINPDTIKPIIFYDNNTKLCGGEEVLLSLPAGQSYQWSTGDTTQTIQAKQTGDYYALVEGYCDWLESDTVHLDFLVPEVPVTTNDTFKLGESAILTATGDNVQWYADPFRMNFLGSGNSFQMDNLTDTVTIYADNTAILEGQDFQVGPAQHTGLTKYNANFVNGGLLFDVIEPIILHQVTIFTDSAGTRIIDINDGQNFFYEFQTELQPGTNVVDLEIGLDIGSYTITTNTEMNNQEFGVNSPYLWRTEDNLTYPYEIAGIVSITNSTYGEDYFYYFYDWKVSTVPKSCRTELVPATAVLDLRTATNEPGVRDQVIMITPNPTEGMSTLTIRSEGKCEIEIMSMDGSRFLVQQEMALPENSFELELSNYPSGIYLVKVIQNGKLFTQKVIKL